MIIARALVVLLAAGVITFNLFAAQAAFRSRVRHRLWWVALCAVAVTRLDFAWSSGAAVVNPLAVVILGVGAVEVGTGWVIHVGFPIGALLTLGKVRTQRVKRGIDSSGDATRLE